MAPTESYDVTGKNTRTSDQRSSEEIRRDIERQRDELDVTTEVLQHKLAPRELAGQLWSDMRTRVGGSAGDVVDVIKRHPLPIGLIGAGIAWWIYETSTGHALSFGNGDSWDEEDEEDGIGSSSTGSYGVGESASLYGTGEYGAAQYGADHEEDEEGWRQRSMHMAQRGTERLRSGAHTAREGFSNAVDRNPLALGAACLSLGILAGIAVPTTRWEDQRMGPTSRRMTRRARRAAADAAANAAHQAARKAEHIREEMERSGSGRDDEGREGQSGSRPSGWSGSGSSYGGARGASGSSSGRTGSDIGTAGSSSGGRGTVGGMGSHGPGTGSKAGSSGIGSTGPSTGSTATGGYGPGTGTGSSMPGSGGRSGSSSTGSGSGSGTDRQDSAGGTGVGTGRGSSGSTGTSGTSGTRSGTDLTGSSTRSGRDEADGPDPWDANNPGRRRS